MSFEGRAAADRPTERIGVHEFLRILRRRWRLFAAVICTVLVLTGVWSFLQTPQYLSFADVLIEPSVSGDTSVGSAEVSQEEVATQVQVVTSLPVARLVQDKLDLEDTPSLRDLVLVEPQGSSRILRISATDPSPAEAADVANAVSEAYLEYREADTARRYEQANQRLADRQATIQTRIDAIDTALATDPDNKAELTAERRSLLTQLGQISTSQSAVDESMRNVGSQGVILQEAVEAKQPFSPRTIFNGVLALCFGVLLAIGAVLVRNRLDDVIHDPAMVRSAIPSGQLLGRIPRWDQSLSRGRLVTLMAPHSSVAEAFRTLAVNVRFLLATSRSHESEGQTVLITSGQSGEGKTETAANLAIAAARNGQRVILVDADLRRPTIARRLGFGELSGLSDLLLEDGRPDRYYVDVGVPRLRLLPAGTVPPNPTALLASPRMRSILADLRKDADLVVIDSSPALVVADALELTDLADLVGIVVRDSKSRRRELSAVVEALTTVGVGSMAGIYNGVEDAGGDAYAAPQRGKDAAPVLPLPPDLATSRALPTPEPKAGSNKRSVPRAGAPGPPRRDGGAGPSDVSRRPGPAA